VVAQAFLQAKLTEMVDASTSFVEWRFIARWVSLIAESPCS